MLVIAPTGISSVVGRPTVGTAVTRSRYAPSSGATVGTLLTNCSASLAGGGKTGWGSSI